MRMVTTMKPSEKAMLGSGTATMGCPPLMKGSSFVCSAWLISLKPMKPRIGCESVVQENDAVKQTIDEEVELTQAEQGERVGGEHQVRLVGERVDRGDRIEGEHQVRGAQGQHDANRGVR